MNTNQVRQEVEATYEVITDVEKGIVAMEDQIIAQALGILQRRMKADAVKIGSPSTVKYYLATKLSGLEHEVFSVIYLDSQHKVIEYEELFRGTLAQTSVYPREVVKSCLKHNAAAVIFAHNHPSGELTPSRADEMLTNTLKSALSLVDVRVLDHIIAGGGRTKSMAELCLI